MNARAVKVCTRTGILIRTYPKTLIIGIPSAENGIFWGFWDDFYSGV